MIETGFISWTQDDVICSLIHIPSAQICEMKLKEQPCRLKTSKHVNVQTVGFSFKWRQRGWIFTRNLLSLFE